MKYEKMDLSALVKERDRLSAEYDAMLSRGLKLDMSRGKPSPEQLDLSSGLLAAADNNFIDSDGNDVRNYGGLAGISEMRDIFAAMLGVERKNVVIGGNSSLTMMYDTVSRAMNFGLAASAKPWKDYKKIKFLCPSPGYDRHFEICRAFGIEMIPIKMTAIGPEVAEVARLVKNDDAIKGMWCIPQYSNPTGITYSAETVQALASMPAKAADFTIFWDNAYCVHHLYASTDKLANILELAAAAGNPERPLVFCSFSKVTYAGASVSCVAGSEKSVESLLAAMSSQIICHDKVNQLLHARYFKDFAGVKAHMERHAELLGPKFSVVLKILDDRLTDGGFAEWSRPHGGYFISLNVMPGTARRTVELCARAGVKLTPAGATFPYGIDPEDSNIRIAPSYPSVAELADATELLCISAGLAAAERLMQYT